MKKFTPKQPDPYIKKDGDQELAKFGHLNAIVAVLNNQSATLTGISANGVIQATATLLGENLNVVSTAGGGNTAVQLPSLTAQCNCIPCGPIAPVIVVNTSGTPILVFPALGEFIDGQGVNTSVTVAPGESLTFAFTSCTTWQTYGASGTTTPFATQIASDFFGLTAGTGNGGATDYAATIPVSTGVINQGVPFPRVAFTSGTFTQPTARKDSVLIPAIGTYKVNFNVNVAEPGQLGIETSTDGGATWAAFVPASDQTVFGDVTAGNHQIVGQAYVTTTAINQLIRVANPAGNSTALTVVPADGDSTHAFAAHFSIEKVA